jgi:hypothetical protein
MATSLGQPTYAQIIDDVRFDVNDGTRLASLADRAIQKWILDAQELVSTIIEVKDSYSLGLNDGVTDYPFQERPAISGATNATPIVITSTAHGLTNNDRIFITGVLGNTAANGAFQIYSSAANYFSIRAVVDISDASNETPIKITATAHGFSTGNQVIVSGVLGNTNANGGYLATVVDVNSFTLDGSTGNGTYTGGGIAVKDSAGNGTYTSGGRYWRDDELPLHIHRLKPIRRPWGDYMREISIVNIDRLLKQEKYDTDAGLAYAADTSPVMAAEFEKLGARYLKVYPEPAEDKTVTIYGTMLPLARNYTSDPLTSSLILPASFEPMIRFYVLGKVYGWLKEWKLSQDMDAQFFRSTQVFKSSQPSYTRLEVTYS